MEETVVSLGAGREGQSRQSKAENVDVSRVGVVDQRRSRRAEDRRCWVCPEKKDRKGDGGLGGVRKKVRDDRVKSISVPRRRSARCASEGDLTQQANGLVVLNRVVRSPMASLRL